MNYGYPKMKPYLRISIIRFKDILKYNEYWNGVVSGSGEEGSSEFSLTKEKFSFFICVYNCLDFSLG